MKLDEHPVCFSEHCVRTAASLLAAMDQSADPCVDFFQFACGSWNKMHRIPDDRSSINVFEVLSDQLQVILKGVLEETYNSEDSDATKKAKRFYKTCMDISSFVNCDYVVYDGFGRVSSVHHRYSFLVRPPPTNININDSYKCDRHPRGKGNCKPEDNENIVRVRN